MKLLEQYLTALNPLWGARPCGVIEQINPLTSHAASITIRPGRGWAGHRAGQFVTLGVDVDGVRHQRCYSITSPEGDPSGRIEIAVAAVPGGVVSNHLVHEARPGELVRLDGPDGDFTIPVPRPGPLLLISAGSGITPLVGMLRSLALGGHRADVVLIHHAPDEASTMFRSELERLAERHPWLRVEIVLTRAGGGHLDADRLANLCPDWGTREAFVCGPDSLLDFAMEHWAASTVEERLHLERFTPPRALRSGADREGNATVRFGASAIAAASDGQHTLLELAETAGVAAPSGCRMGICHTCTTRLDNGCVRDLRDGRVIEAGSHVQLCVSVAEGDVTLDI